MIRIGFFAKNRERREFIEREAARLGIKGCGKPESADVIVSFGGDGTYLMCERKYPGVPKLLLRDSRVCNKCVCAGPMDALRKAAKGEFRINEQPKLCARANGEELAAANDITVRNRDQAKAIRFSVEVNGKKSGTVIGDGIVVSTPFGSTAYYHSITGKSFEKGKGFGLAYNNPTKKREPLALSAGFKAKLTMLRGKAEISADNNPKRIIISDGEFLTISACKEKARIAVLK